ncbi:MAG: hypothetical protein ACFFCW_33295 [Candidatus Hodarchaeota archaeon]
MENHQVEKTGLLTSEVSLGRNNRRNMKKSIFISVLLLILSFNSIFIARAIGTSYCGRPPSEIPSGTSIWNPGGPRMGDEEVENIHQLADQGVKIIYGLLWWTEPGMEGRNALDIYYNATFREQVDQVIAYNFDGSPPDFYHGEHAWKGLNPEKLWAVVLGDEEPGCYGGSEFYSSLSDDIAKYSEPYYAETGFHLKPLWEANETEAMVFWEWFMAKNAWAYNHLYDYIKSKWSHLLVFQYTFMVPVWGIPELVPPYDLKADAYFMDCYYAHENPWLLYETIRRYKSTFPDKEFYIIIAGGPLVLWDLVDETGVYYKIDSFEQFRREAWVSYLAGADAIDWFTWGPQDEYGLDWRWGVDRTDIQGRRHYLYTTRLNRELTKLPVLNPEPQVLAVGEGFQTGQPMQNFVDVGLFSEFDAVNERAFAKLNLDLSQYKLIVLTESKYREETVRKLNAYVAKGGNLLFLGGMGPSENIYANATRTHRFPIEENAQSFVEGYMKINITRPNILDLELVYDGYFHQTYVMQLEKLMEHYHPIGDFYLIEDSTPIMLNDYPLILYHNELNPKSGWILYWGALSSSRTPGTTWETYDSLQETDLWFLHREVFRAFANFLNLSNCISIRDHENILITQARLDDGTILVGLSNFYPENQSITNSVDLTSFGLPDGEYWVHSLDANATVGLFEAQASKLAFSVDLIANGTRLLLISQTKPEPDYSVEIFPEIPTIEELTTTTTTEVSATTPLPEDLHWLSVLLGLGAITTIKVIVVVRKRTRERRLS